MSERASHLIIGGVDLEIWDTVARNSIGAPATASTVAGMTDTSKVYVYTGSETGYTAGNWYYYDGSAWVSGGIYNSTAFETDETLTEQGAAADAKATGDAIGAVESALATKAEIDGAYDGMTVGNAEQLVSNVGIEDSTPYNFRTSGGYADIGDREVDKIVGGTIAWNQLIKNGNFASTSDWTNQAVAEKVGFSASGNVGKLTILDATYGGRPNLASSSIASPVVGHKYLFNGGIKITTATNTARTFALLFGNYNTIFNSVPLNAWNDFATILNVSSSQYANGILYITTVASTFNANDTIEYRNIEMIDLTQMFGSTIANYIYSLEQSTAGAGVAWFKKLFPKPYYAYNAGQLMSVKTSKHKMVGFNAYDSTTGKAKVVGGNQYQITGIFSALSLGGEIITPDASGYFTPSASGELTVTGGGSTTCIHLVWDGERDGEYEEYKTWEYPLDSDLELRGIPKLSAGNDLYYDGDVYSDDGTVVRKYGIVDLGTLTWAGSNGSFSVRLADMRAINHLNEIPMVCSKYPIGDASTDKTIRNNNGYIAVYDTAYTDAATFKTAMSGVYLVYELATPTTESADPYQNPQIVDDFGTEEYVDSRDVAIPVGHETFYQANLKAKLEMAPNSPDGDGDYVVRQTNGQNEYVPLLFPASDIPAPPSALGNYTLQCAVDAEGNAVYSWEEI